MSKDRFRADLNNVELNASNRIFGLLGVTVREFINNKWEIIKKCETYNEAINLLKRLQKNDV